MFILLIIPLTGLKILAANRLLFTPKNLTETLKLPNPSLNSRARLKNMFRKMIMRTIILLPMTDVKTENVMTILLYSMVKPNLKMLMNLKAVWNIYPKITKQLLKKIDYK